MIKYTLITLFTSVTLFFSAVFADGVVIDHNLPQTLQPGEKTTVSVNINKGEVTGFAKLQLEIPAGLTARAIKKSGASFTFSGQKAKFIWMSLPDKQEFSVEYELEANANVSGSKVVTGQFSYIKENERVDYDLAPKVVNVGDVLVDGSSNSDTDESTSNGEEMTSSSSDAACTRIMTEISDGEYFVELSATDVITDGFAKIIEDVSSGYEIKEDASGESIVTIEGNRIKFVWFEKPLDNSYGVSYTLVSTNAENKPEIKGDFSFVQDNTPIEVPVVHQEMISSRDFGGSENLADNAESSEEESLASTNDTATTGENTVKEETIETPVNTASEEEVADASPETPNNSDNTSTKTESTSENNISEVINSSEVVADNSASTIPDPETGINYKVQISATHKYVTAPNFKKKHSFKGTIQTENHEGWTKFVTGSHNQYKDARDARNNITSQYKFNGPFVTAYNDGERITVQEALMISKQKWYQ